MPQLIPFYLVNFPAQYKLVCFAELAQADMNDNSISTNTINIIVHCFQSSISLHIYENPNTCFPKAC